MKIGISTIKSLMLCAAGSALLHACKKTEDAPPLPENRILQFAVTNAADGPVQGVINHKDATIVLYIPYYTALLSLQPEIKIPAGATVTPASNTFIQNWAVKQAMDSAMTYTVKAKDGSTANYKLRIDGQQPEITVNEITTDPAKPFTLTHKHKSESEIIGVAGDNLIPNFKTNFITLVNEQGKGFTLETKSYNPIGYKNFTGSIPPDSNALPSGKYAVRVTCFSKTVKLKNPVFIKQIP
ncbi:hypothetical protein [Chitinophaga arvensicola]|nr:hypothetical protein [Chitinophaga arvensicola]